jgi:DHA2 family methylenomycin A resistance protein-like MFS transporter
MASARQLGGVIGVAVFGTLIARADAAAFAHGMSNAMLVSAITLVVCIVAMTLINRGKA